jgi:hypothetical protein
MQLRSLHETRIDEPEENFTPIIPLPLAFWTATGQMRPANKSIWVRVLSNFSPVIAQTVHELKEAPMDVLSADMIVVDVAGLFHSPHGPTAPTIRAWLVRFLRSLCEQYKSSKYMILCYDAGKVPHKAFEAASRKTATQASFSAKQLSELKSWKIELDAPAPESTLWQGFLLHRRNRDELWNLLCRYIGPLAAEAGVTTAMIFIGPPVDGDPFRVHIPSTEQRDSIVAALASIMYALFIGRLQQHQKNILTFLFPFFLFFFFFFVVFVICCHNAIAQSASSKGNSRLSPSSDDWL